MKMMLSIVIVLPWQEEKHEFAVKNDSGKKKTVNEMQLVHGGLV
jgi:hypothetical protein